MFRQRIGFCVLGVACLGWATACGSDTGDGMGDAGASRDAGVPYDAGKLRDAGMVVTWGPDPVRITTLRQDEPTDHSSGLSSFVKIGDIGYFLADDGFAETALWRTDGTAAGTSIVADINPNGADRPQSLIKVGETLFLVADNGTHGLELFKSDGTAAGTTLVKDINTNGDAIRRTSSLVDFVAVGNVLYFVADDGTHGRELFKSDGTAAGTTLVKDIHPDGDAFNPFLDPSFGLFAALDGEVFFRADDGTHQHALYKSDGTSAGTLLVKDFDPQFPDHVSDRYANPKYLTTVDDTLFFVAHDGVHGEELYKSDGTTAGTVLVRDINMADDSWPYGRNRGPRDLTNLNGTLFFVAREGRRDIELYRSDGTREGTVMVKWINTDGPANPYGLSVVDGAFFFYADREPSRTELYRSDGTAAGTMPFREFISAPADLTTIRRPTRFNGRLYFGADDGSHGYELYSSDGTAAGASLVKDIHPEGNSSLSILREVQGHLLLVADDGVHGRELFRTDGTPEGTVMVKNIRATKDGFGPNRAPVTLKDRLVFWGTDEAHGTELYVSDGTAAGTALLMDVTPGPTSSIPTNSLVVGDTFFFSVFNQPHGGALYKTDGTVEGTMLVKQIHTERIARIDAMVDVNGRLFFRAEDGVHGAELYTSDGTNEGTVLVRDIHPGTADSNPARPTALGNMVFFFADDGTHGNELFRSDGTAAGTRLVKDIRPGSASGTRGSSYSRNIARLGDEIYFMADDGVHGLELYRTDGTAEGTVMVADIHKVEGRSSYPTQFTPINEVLYFAAEDGIHGRELYRSDGTAAGTVMLKDILPGEESSSPFHLTSVNGVLYFQADDGIHGHELYRSDGTATGTVMLKDIHPFGSAGLKRLASLNGFLLFIADNAIHGEEPYMSDGTPEGTVLIGDIYPGPHSSPRGTDWAALGERIFFGASDGTHGTQLWGFSP